jgi:hypothetical protein
MSNTLVYTTETGSNPPSLKGEVLGELKGHISDIEEYSPKSERVGVLQELVEFLNSIPAEDFTSRWGEIRVLLLSMGSTYIDKVLTRLAEIEPDQGC